MQIPLKISFRHMEHSPAIEAEIRDKVAQLETFFDRIIGCTVVIEAPHHHHHKGNLYHVRLRISVPQQEIFVDREPSAHQAHQDVHVTIRDAFKEARRQLQDYARQMRGDVKAHESALGGLVSKLFPEEGYGFIETSAGREVYFHANSVLDVPFEQLDVGSEVRFVEEPGEKGPQATSVRLVGHHHHVVE